MVVGQENLARLQPELHSKLGVSQETLHDPQGLDLPVTEGPAGLPVADLNVVVQIAHGEFAGFPGENGVLRSRRFALAEFSPAIEVERLVKARQQVDVLAEQVIVQGDGADQLGLSPLDGGTQTE